MSPKFGFAEGDLLLLDSVALVYFIEQNPRYFTLADAIIRWVVSGGLPAVASSLILSEVLVFAYRGGSPATARTVRDAIRRLPNLSVVDVTQQIADDAASVRARHNLRTPDAIHVATGLRRRATWMVTNDRRLRRVEADGLKVWLFDEHL